MHTAIRLLLPLLPALAASSPIAGRKWTGNVDSRLHAYVHHCDAIPPLIGKVIPEVIRDQDEYDRIVYRPIGAAIAENRMSPVMRAEFLNARGAIARFDRGSIEIRVMDVQEYPGADVAICAAIVSVLRDLVDQQWCTLEQQALIDTDSLRAILDATIRDGEHVVIQMPEYLSCFGLSQPSIKVSKIWSTLLDRARRRDSAVDNLFAPLQVIRETGTLSHRIRQALANHDTPCDDDLLGVYEQLADCLVRWEPFQP